MVCIRYRRFAYVDAQSSCEYAENLCEYAQYAYEYTYLLTPWSIAILEKLTVFQPVKKFPTFHGTRRFITAVTSAHHLFLSWASSIQFIYPHTTSWRPIFILSFLHLRLVLPSGPFPSSFPVETLYTPILSLVHATGPSHLILLDFNTRTI